MMRLDDKYAQELLIPSTRRRSPITKKEWLPQTKHNDFKHNRGRNPRSFVIGDGSEECTIWIEPGSHKYVFYSDEKKADLSEVLKMEEVKLQKEHVLFGHGLMQHAGGA